MFVPGTKHVFEILLPNPIDGEEIEAYIEQNQLRAKGDYFFGSEHEPEFQPGKLYRVIMIGTNASLFEKSSTRELAKHFNGAMI